MSKKIIVVGAGPAGMMAAIRASELDAQVLIIEKNKQAGRKLLLSGKGRCNLTNYDSLEEFLPRYNSGGQFLRSAFSKFFNQELMHFFEFRGLRLNVERQNRIFPDTNSSASVVDVLLREIHRNNVKIFYGSVVDKLIVKDKKIEGVVLKDGQSFEADAVILATGGISYAFTGSTGDGIRIAKQLGHNIISLRAGLVPIETKRVNFDWPQGLTLKNIVLKFIAGKKKITTDVGELLFTHNGISGPLILSWSGQIVDWLDEGLDVCVEVDLKPGLTIEQLEKRLLREFQEYSNKSIRNVLKELVPSSMVEVFIQRLKLDPDKKTNQINQKERKDIIGLLKSFKIDVLRSLPIEEAMVTKGGVSLKEVNPRDMQSKLISGLYFAGEILDIDADTGGFNLQAAFSTGYLAGESAALG